MSAEAVIQIVIEAIERRGFSKAEASKMIQIVKDGNFELPAKVETGKEEFDRIFKKGYDAGLREGKLQEQAQEYTNRMNEAPKEQQCTYNKYAAQQNMGFGGLRYGYGAGLGSIFGNSGQRRV